MTSDNENGFGFGNCINGGGGVSANNNREPSGQEEPKPSPRPRQKPAASDVTGSNPNKEQTVNKSTAAASDDDDDESDDDDDDGRRPQLSEHSNKPSAAKMTSDNQEGYVTRPPLPTEEQANRRHHQSVAVSCPQTLASQSDRPAARPSLPPKSHLRANLSNATAPLGHGSAKTNDGARARQQSASEIASASSNKADSAGACESEPKPARTESNEAKPRAKSAVRSLISRFNNNNNDN